ncbi:acetyl-CoA carboxylase carboxyltransferase subunit alpha [Candidatus Riflebacteria bacterium]
MEMNTPFSELESKLLDLKSFSEDNQLDLSGELSGIEDKIKNLKKSYYEKMTPPQIVQIARHNLRPTSLDYIQKIFTDFTELHGDRQFADDTAIVGGVAEFNGEPVFIVAQQKGKDTNMNLFRNFGMAHPEGYRKALRLMRMAEKFKKPIFVFIDTPGAYPGMEAEERGQAEAIARNIRDMSTIQTPIIALVVGEGGSGGALGIGVADIIIMLEFSIYSVISPEGCSSILFKSPEHAQEAAEMLKLTSFDLRNLKVIDEIVQEPTGGAHNDPQIVVNRVKSSFEKNLKNLKKLSLDTLIQNRYNKYRNIGVYME